VSIFITEKLKRFVNTYIPFISIVDDATIIIQEMPKYFRCFVINGSVENYYFQAGIGLCQHAFLDYSQFFRPLVPWN